MQPLQSGGMPSAFDRMGRVGQESSSGSFRSFLQAVEGQRAFAHQEPVREVSQKESLQRLQMGTRGVVKVALTFSYLTCYTPAQLICSLMGVAIIASRLARGSSSEADLPYTIYDGAMIASAPSRWLVNLVQSAIFDFAAAFWSQEDKPFEEKGVKASFADLSQEIEMIFELKKERVTALQKSVAMICVGATAAAFAVNRLVFAGFGFIGGYLIVSAYWRGAKEEAVKNAGVVIALLPGITVSAIGQLLSQSVLECLAKTRGSTGG